MCRQSSSLGRGGCQKIEKGTGLPTGYSHNGIINGASCGGVNCVAAGRYHDGSTYYPLLVVSQNSGSNWTYKIEKGVALPTDFSIGELYSASCNGVTCVAAGSYSDGSINYPILAVSQDSGSNWTYKIEKGAGLPTDFSANGKLNSASCNGVNCVAVGQYSDGSVNYPIIVVSHDSGGSWTYKSQKGLGLPTGYANFADLKSASCNGTNCIVTGQYSDSTVLYPLLAISQDSGKSWVYKIDKGAVLPAGYSNFGALNSGNCNGVNCVAAGYYTDGSIYYPILVISQDSGASWTYKLEKGVGLPVDMANSFYLNSASCNGVNCAAAGYYSDGSDFYPVLVVSHDSGATWRYSVEKGLGLPLDFTDFGWIGSESWAL